MAFFPRDERNKDPPSKRRRKLAQERNRDYPNVEQGLIGAATLSEDKDMRLKWVYVAQPSGNQNGESRREDPVQGSYLPDVSRKRLKYGKQLDVFPSTCPIPWNAAPTSIQQRAEQGANFLRTHLPDVEIPEELIRDQLVEDITLSRGYKSFDPYLGNLLEIFEPQNGNDSAFLIFPTGEINRDLNFTNISYSDSHDVFFRSSNEPFYRSSTPIRQVLVSKPSNGLSNDAVLAVRTFSSTHILGLKHLESSASLTATSLYAITCKDMENETALDIRHLLSSNVVLAVGDGGTVFACDPTNGAKKMTLLHKETDQALPSRGYFRLLALDKEPSNYFLLSSKKVQQLDMRMRPVNELYSISTGKHVFTSLEDCHQGHIVHLCSTNQVIWMDTRFPRKPLLAYGHGRQHDRSLSTRTFDCGFCNPITILASRHNSLITVYDVSQPIDDLIQLNILPYDISPDFTMYRKPAGLQVLNFKQYLGLARLSEMAGLSYSELLLTGSQGAKQFTIEMSKDMQTKAVMDADLRPDAGPLGIQEFSQVDLQGAYEELFSRYFKERKELEEATAESVYELVDSFPSYFQIKELPTEHVLTTFDVILRAGDDPDRATRADFLTESVINSKRGFRALKQGRLAPELINVQWKKSLLPVFQKLDPEFQADHQLWMEYSQKFNLSDSGERSNWSREFELESCRQLVMDLVLSSDIYSDSTFAKLGEVDQTLETMTEALSLGDEPPHVEFGYLKPVERNSTNDELHASGSQVPDLPIGVRSLLKDWDDLEVEDYSYRDPYHGVGQPLPLKRMKSAPPSHHNLVVQSQRPPAILASNVTGDRLPDELRGSVQSQDCFLTKRDSATDGLPHATPQFPSCQELDVSTQVLPGPHGGRPTMKKRPAKKRLGGF